MRLASLRLTVALFAMAIFIIFAGTFAQWQKDIWQVVDDYFRTPIAWIDFQIFFPPSFFPSQPKVPGGFYFPGGWLIGTLMGVNLLAAHGIRFKPQASGTRLAIGFAVIGVGMLITWAAIATGNNKDGVLEATWISWPALWTMCKAGLAALWLVCVASLFRLEKGARSNSGRCRFPACYWACWLPGSSTRARPRGSTTRACGSFGN